MRLFLLSLATFFLVSCSSNSKQSIASLVPSPQVQTVLKITYTSNPIGAVLTCNHKNFGYTPVTLTYLISKNEQTLGNALIAPCSVVWSSGATTINEKHAFKIDLNKHGYSQIYTFQRPVVDGYEIDSKFALQLDTARKDEKYKKQQYILDSQRKNELIIMQNQINEIMYNGLRY